MDNKNVHIDELFKQRFENESDREHIHQSWKKMERMLDGEKERRRFVFWKGLNWLIPGILIALIATVGVGYWLDKDQNEIEGVATNNRPIAPANSNSAIPSIPSTTSVDDGINAREESNHTTNTQANSQHHVTSHKTVSKSYTSAQQIKSSVRKSKQNTPGNDGTDAKIAGALDNESTEYRKVKGRPIAIDGAGNVIAAAPSQLGKKIADRHTIKSKDQQQIIEQLEIAANNELLVVDKKDNTLKKIEEKLVKGVHLDKYYTKDPNAADKFIVHHDTIGFKDVKKVDYVPLSDSEISALQGLALVQEDDQGLYDHVKIERFSDANEVNEMAMLTASNTGKEKITTNVEERKKSSFFKDVNNFFEIKNKFYTTIFGGMNVSTNSFFPIGFQGGAGLHYMMGSRWSIGAEIGYSYRPMNYSYTDEQNTYTQIGAGIPVSGGTMFNYKEDKESNVYNFRYLNTLELPIVLTYHGDKWSFFGGPSLNFASKISYQKLSSFNSADKMIVLQGVESFDEVMKNTTLQSTPADFDSRMGLGMNLGARYALTDRLGLTATYSQVFYDNAKTKIGQTLSTEMFRIPSIRIGVTYRLDNDKKVKYIMGQ